MAEQLAFGNVTLGFESGSESTWNAATFTYTDGANQVTVSGVTDVSLKFADDGSNQYDILDNVRKIAHI